MTLDYWKLGLEFLKAILSWPVVVLVLCTLFMIRFKDPITEFIKRLRKVTIPGGGQITADAQQATAAPPPAVNPLEQKADEIAPGADHVGLEGQAPVVAAPAQPAPGPAAPAITHPQLMNDPRAPAAVAYVTAHPQNVVVEYKDLWINYQHERLFNNILGTQYRLMEFMAGRPAGTTIGLDLVMPFHMRHQDLVNSKNYGIRDYIGFLVNFGAVTRSGTEQNPQFALTAEGLQFLSYIRSRYLNPADLRMG